MCKPKFLNVCIVLLFILSATAAATFAKPHFSLLTEEDWLEGLDLNIRGMNEPEWKDYQEQFNNPDNLEGEPYPETTFLTPELYVYPSELDPCDAGLVMAWGNPDLTDGNYASAWVYEYGVDPDLSNSTLTIQVEPPCGITTISIGLRDINLRTRSWTWNVAPFGAVPPLPPGTLQCSPDAAGAIVQHKIKINLAMTGVAAATPVANSYSNYNSPPNSAPAFNIKNVQALIFDENANIMAQAPVPPPGKKDPRPWNYWLNLVVTPNPSGGSGAGAWYVKWSQPPVPLDPAQDPPVFNGWDEKSDYNNKPIAADDWKCTDKRPVTDIHWWGSFVGWDLHVPPPVVPKAFHIGIWTDVPVSDNNPNFSHPGFLIWENYCDTWVWNFVGYDKDPWQVLDVNDACFQFTQLLSQDEWFFQDPNGPWDTDGDPSSAVFWLSISAVYDAADYPLRYPWGWKTRPHFFNDDAVRIFDALNPPIDDPTYVPWPPTIGAQWIAGEEIYGPDGASWDLSFELTTKDPAYEDNPIPGDSTLDGIVNNLDLAVLADNWLTSVSIP